MLRKFILVISLILLPTFHNTGLGFVNANFSQELTTPELIKFALENGEIDDKTAYLYLSIALSDYDKLPEQYKSDLPWDGTLTLLQLQDASQVLSTGPELLAVESVVAGACHSGPARSASLTNVESDNFYIEYGPIGGGLTINDYINALETTWKNEISDFGWAKPPKLPNDPLGNQYHVIIQDLGNSLFGYVSPSGTYAGYVGDNPYTGWNDVDAYDSCMVINSDLSRLSQNPQAALEATAGHEFNHAIQFGYGVLSGNNIPDESFIEGGATWMEDEVFDASNDNYNFLWPKFNQCMGEYQDNPYSYWITFRGLTEQFGNGSPNGGEQVMQDFWEETSKSSTSNMLEALNFALENKGSNLGTAFHIYAIAVYFNKPCTGKYNAPYCFEEGPEYIKSAGQPPNHKLISEVGGSASGSIADNYTINWVRLPVGNNNYDLTLSNTSTGGQFRASVVCDTGKTLKITSFSNIAGKGESSSVINFDPSSCSDAVAVITNQSQTAANPTFCNARGYTITTSPSMEYFEQTYFPIITTLIENVLPPVEIPNWNFEKGPQDWIESSSNGWNLIVDTLPPGISPHSGNWLAWLGGDNNENSYIEQEFIVPNETSILTYWYWIDSEDECGADLDFAEVIVNGSDVVDSFDLCTTRSTNGWEMREIELKSYAGNKINFRFRVQTDGAIPSNLFLEDFTFDSQETAGPVYPLIPLRVDTSILRKSDVLSK